MAQLDNLPPKLTDEEILKLMDEDDQLINDKSAHVTDDKNDHVTDDKNDHEIDDKSDQTTDDKNNQTTDDKNNHATDDKNESAVTIDGGINLEDEKFAAEYSFISKINSYLFLGSYAHPWYNTKEFQELKIDVIINCATEIIYPDTNKYHVDSFPIDEDEYATLLECMDDAHDKIHQYLKERKRIYLHCTYGHSRAPAILIYYLMAQKKFTYDKSYKLLKQKRSVLDIHPNFERELRTYGML